MEILILIILIIVLIETSFLVLKKHNLTQSSTRKIFVDTSAIIDGRIINIARTGFIDGVLIIPKSVLRELQLIADSKDNEKRNRARAGLKNVPELERIIEINTEILDDGDTKINVDDQLLRLAKDNKGTILTMDFNLMQVARAEKIPTLNINDLALAARTEFLPGEKIELQITERGSGRGQGVGHLNDGTMVVVNRGASYLGKIVTVEFERFRETSSGKMIFAKISKN